MKGNENKHGSGRRRQRKRSPRSPRQRKRSQRSQRQRQIIRSDGGGSDRETCIIDNDAAVVYIFGDLEGESNLLKNWLLEKKFIDDEKTLKWTAPPNVYIVQCGDQLDSAELIADTKIIKKISLINRRQKFDPLYTVDDLELARFTDKLNINSDNHFLSILGNHELTNIHKNFSYVSYKSCLNDEDKVNAVTHYRATTPNPNEYNKLVEKYAACIDKYQQQRTDLLKYDGEIGKIMRRRNFIIRINNVLISHAGITRDLLKKFKDQEESKTAEIDLDKFINTVNNQISDENNFNEESCSDFFKSIITNTKTRYYLGDTSRFEIPDELSHYIQFMGHNYQATTKFCEDDVVTKKKKCFTSKDKKNDWKWVITDVGAHPYDSPYMEAIQITFKDKKLDKPSISIEEIGKK